MCKCACSMFHVNVPLKNKNKKNQYTYHKPRAMTSGIILRFFLLESWPPIGGPFWIKHPIPLPPFAFCHLGRHRWVHVAMWIYLPSNSEAKSPKMVMDIKLLMWTQFLAPPVIVRFRSKQRLRVAIENIGLSGSTFLYYFIKME